MKKDPIFRLNQENPHNIQQSFFSSIKKTHNQAEEFNSTPDKIKKIHNIKAEELYSIAKSNQSRIPTIKQNNTIPFQTQFQT